ncbi:Glycerol kinase [Zea mays]|uniref:Glycerol kinase n=1 Tax=Zea mays TaxID=4577 RepID=A0A3L6F861_MAIZE|nr:Glycerol kinase [Zea mays]
MPKSSLAPKSSATAPFHRRRTTHRRAPAASLAHHPSIDALPGDWKNELSGDRTHFVETCGLPISTYFSAMKLLWLMENVVAMLLLLYRLRKPIFWYHILVYLGQVLRSQQCLAFSMFFLPIMESSQQMIQPTTWTQPCSSLSHDWSPFVMELAVATTLSTLNVKDVIDVMPGLMKSSVALLNQADLGWYFL